MQIINGLHQIKTSMLRPHLPYVMCYVFEDHSGKITLFDTGFGTDTAFEELKNGLHDTKELNTAHKLYNTYPIWMFKMVDRI